MRLVPDDLLGIAWPADRGAFCGYLDVRQSWDRGVGLRPPKWNSFRKVPIGKAVRDALEAVIGGLEYRESDDLVFACRNRGNPIDHKLVFEALYEAMHAAGITEDERRARGISFHSWRHFATTQLRAAGLPDPMVRAVTGHRTVAMLDPYGAHFDGSHFADAVRTLEGSIGESA